jgi:transposase
MVELVKAGRDIEGLAKEFGCHATSILGWVRKANAGDSRIRQQQSAVLNDSTRQELLELRRKLKQVQMERDILAKATAWFAGNSAVMSTSFTR